MNYVAEDATTLVPVAAAKQYLIGLAMMTGLKVARNTLRSYARDVIKV